MISRTFALGLIMLVGLSISVSGCDKNSDVAGPQDHLAEYAFPDSPEALMRNFSKAYVGMDLDAYRNVVGADYRFKFQSVDVDHLGLPSDHLTCQEEIQVADHMFHGGGAEPIAKITVQVLEPQTGWMELGADPNFPGAHRAVFSLVMTIERPGETTLEIAGLQEFFAFSRDTTLSGGIRTEYWQLVGQIDRTQSSWAKGVGSISWGAVKNMYR
jgi:hypothetical protein